MQAPDDGLIGQRFGSWVVESEASRKESIRRFHCICDCGSQKVVGGYILRHGKSTQCRKCAAFHNLERVQKLTTEEAYRRHPDMVLGQEFQGRKKKYKFWCETHGEYEQIYDNHVSGKRCKKCATDKLRHHPEVKAGASFDRWTVEGRVENINGRSLWRCRCACGQVQLVRGSRIHRLTQCHLCSGRALNGHIPRLSGDMAARNACLCATKARARQRGLEWALSEDTFDKLSRANCYYCDTSPANKCKQWKSVFVYSGIDRVDNTKGYVDGNVVSCCRRCNEWKHAMTVTDFLTQARKIVEKQNG